MPFIQQDIATEIDQTFPGLFWPLPITARGVSDLGSWAASEAVNRGLEKAAEEIIGTVVRIRQGPGSLIELVLNPTQLGSGDVYIPPPAGRLGPDATDPAGPQRSGQDVREADVFSGRDP